MKTLLRSIIITIVSILFLTWWVPGVSVANTVTLFLAGAVLALLNTTIRPILKILFLPINLVTLGIFGWLINVLILYLAMWLVPGFVIGEVTVLGLQLSSFWSVVVVSIILSLFSSVVGMVL